MTTHTSNNTRKGASFRPELQRLEDRLVPGQVLETALLWALGPLAFPALAAQENPGAETPTGAGARPATGKPTGSTANLELLTVCPLTVDASSIADGTAVTRSATNDDVDPANADGDLAATGFGPDVGSDTMAVPAAAAPDHAVDSLSVPTQSAPIRASAASVAGPAAGAAAQPAPGAASVVAPAMSAGGAGAALPAAGSAAAETLLSGVSVDGGEAGGEAAPMAHARQVAAPDAGGVAKPFGANGAAPFSPAQIKQAYGFNQISNQGAGQTIYIVDAYNDPNIANDLKTFDAQWGLPNPSFTVHKMTNSVANNTSWGLEESLDVEWAHAIAPQANIVLVEASSAYLSDLLKATDWATNNGAHIVSMSWGGGDSSSATSLDSHFNHPGVSYVASAGDTGGIVSYPAASPYVLSVGGTSLTLNSSNGYVSEKAWSNGGGGASVVESEPGYQKNYSIKLSGRGTPDVAYNADPNTGFYVYDSYYSGGGGWFDVGGTSAGAPQWAALIALADQSRSTPLSTNDLTTRSEYSAAATTIYSSNYHDVTTGSNGYAASTGYDLATGLGSPKANALVPWLIAHG